MSEDIRQYGTRLPEEVPEFGPANHPTVVRRALNGTGVTITVAANVNVIQGLRRGEIIDLGDEVVELLRELKADLSR